MKTQYQAAKKALLKTLKQEGIQNERVLQAIQSVPREYFVLAKYRNQAYNNSPLPLIRQQTISQPYTMARMTELLYAGRAEKKLTKVLEIGTGFGYQTAILAELADQVYSIERIKSLHQRAYAILKQLGYGERIRLKFGDGYEGWPEFAPFPAIIVTAAVPVIPSALLQQLELDGQLVLPVGEGFQKLQRVTRVTDSDYAIENFGKVVFVPMISGVDNF